MTDTPSSPTGDKSASLTDRMRTCAAYLCGAEKAGDGSLRDFGRAIIDAADLLIEASNALEKLCGPVVYDDADQPVGEPMEIIPPSRTSPPVVAGTWVAIGDTLPVARPTSSPRTCPKCDSRANKRVRRDGTGMVLVCPVCAHVWPYTKKPPAEGTAGG